MELHNSTSRLRMFAGPNGSGKTTIKSVIRQELLGIYINPDDTEYRFKSGGHNVPKDKIVSRYYRSLDLLRDAIKSTNRVPDFDSP